MLSIFHLRLKWIIETVQWFNIGYSKTVTSVDFICMKSKRKRQPFAWSNQFWASDKIVYPEAYF